MPTSHINNLHAKWAAHAAQFPPDYFTTIPGQRVALSLYAHVERPVGWSLPAGLGPWPTDPESAALLILSLLPGVSAEIVGDLLFGPWRFRSSGFGAIGSLILESLRRQNKAASTEGDYWTGWTATKPIAAKLDPSVAHSPAVRALLDRLRLAVHEAVVAPRLGDRRRRDETHLRELETMPVEAHDASWKAEFAVYSAIVAAWRTSGTGIVAK